MTGPEPSDEVDVETILDALDAIDTLQAGEDDDLDAE
jgi:hypothetical protein